MNIKPTIINIGNIHSGIPQTDGIKLGVFDKKDNFYGYKSDSFWSLNKDSYKEHSYGSEEGLIKNFLSVLNNKNNSKPGTAEALVDVLSQLQKNYDLAELIQEDEIFIRSFDLKNGEVIKIIKLIKADGAWEIRSP